MNIPLRSQILLKGEPAQEWKRYEQKFVHLIKGRELGWQDRRVFGIAGRVAQVSSDVNMAGRAKGG